MSFIIGIWKHFRPFLIIYMSGIFIQTIVLFILYNNNRRYHKMLFGKFFSPHITCCLLIFIFFPLEHSIITVVRSIQPANTLPKSYFSRETLTRTFIIIIVKILSFCSLRTSLLM